MEVVLHGQARSGPPPDQETSSGQVNARGQISLLTIRKTTKEKQQTRRREREEQEDAGGSSTT